MIIIETKYLVFKEVAVLNGENKLQGSRSQFRERPTKWHLDTVELQRVDENPAFLLQFVVRGLIKIKI